ncbi:hypothetical protein MRB53_038501 [Persea americana]|nr:hypothetical protein MRB53_038501 [Persea americana]
MKRKRSRLSSAMLKGTLRQSEWHITWHSYLNILVSNQPYQQSIALKSCGCCTCPVQMANDKVSAFDANTMWIRHDEDDETEMINIISRGQTIVAEWLKSSSFADVLGPKTRRRRDWRIDRHSTSGVLRTAYCALATRRRCSSSRQDTDLADSCMPLSPLINTHLRHILDRHIELLGETHGPRPNLLNSKSVLGDELPLLHSTLKVVRSSSAVSQMTRTATTILRMQGLSISAGNVTRHVVFAEAGPEARRRSAISLYKLPSTC